MTLNTLFYILSMSGILIIIGQFIFYFQTFNHKRTTKTILISLILPLLLIMSNPIFKLVDHVVHNIRYNSFIVEIGESFDTIDYDKLYEDIYQKSNAEAPLVAYIPDYSSDFSFYLEADGKINEMNFGLYVYKYNRYYLYQSYYENGKLFFSCNSSINEKKVGETYNLSTYFERIKTFDSYVILDYLKQEEYKDGIGVDVSFLYIEESYNINLKSNEGIRFYAFDKNNGVHENEEVLFEKYHISIRISDGTIINGIPYIHYFTDTISLLNWVE